MTGEARFIGCPPIRLTVMSDSAQLEPTKQWREFLLVAALAFSLTATLLARADILTSSHPVFDQPADHHKYIHMAQEGPWGFHIAPYCWRVGVPGIAGLLGAGQWSFLILAGFAVTGTGVVVFYTVNAWGASTVSALFGMALFFSMGWAARFPLHDFWLPDAVAFFFIAMATLSILRGWGWVFALTLALGVCVKESVFLAAPLYLTLSRVRQGSPWAGVVGRWLVLIAPAVLVFVFLRLSIEAGNDDAAYVASLPTKLTQVTEDGATYRYLDSARIVGEQRLRSLSWSALHSYSIEPFGVAALGLSFVGAWRYRRLLLKWSPLLLLVYAQLLVATDTQRLLVAAFPAVILLAACGAEVLMARLGLSCLWLVPMPIVLIGVNLMYLHRVSAPTSVQACVVGVYLLVTVVAGSVTRRAKLPA